MSVKHRAIAALIDFGQTILIGYLFSKANVLLFEHEVAVASQVGTGWHLEEISSGPPEDIVRN